MTDPNILQQDLDQEIRSAIYCGRTWAILRAAASPLIVSTPHFTLSSVPWTLLISAPILWWGKLRLTEGKWPKTLPAFVLMESKIKAGGANVHHSWAWVKMQTHSAASIPSRHYARLPRTGGRDSAPPYPAVCSCDLQNVSTIGCLLHRIFIKCPMQSQLILAWNGTNKWAEKWLDQGSYI